MGNGSSRAGRLDGILEVLQTEDVALDDEEFWASLWNEKVYLDELHEIFPFEALRALCITRPQNIKSLLRNAVSTISKFMESNNGKYGGSSNGDTAVAVARVLTAVLPAVLEDDRLAEWCWEEHRLSHYLTYMNGDDPDQGPLTPSPRRAAAAAAAASATAAARGEGAGFVSDANGYGFGSAAEKAGTTAAAAANGGGYGDGNGGQGDWEDIGPDFPVCLASILLHTATNLLFYPGLCVDPAAPDHDDEYSPVPEHCYGLKDPAYVWRGGAAVGDESVVPTASLDDNRIDVLRLYLVVLSRPLYRVAPSVVAGGAAAAVTAGGASPAAAFGAAATIGGGDGGGGTGSGGAGNGGSVGGNAAAAAASAATGPTGTVKDRWSQLATARHLPFTAELFYSLLNTALAPDASSWGLRSLGIGLGLGGGGRGGGGGGSPPSIPVAALQLLLALLQHGSPYGTILERLGQDAAAAPDELELELRAEAGGEPDYNSYRRCLWVLHGHDLDFVATGILELLASARTGGSGGGGGSGESGRAAAHEPLLLLAAMLDENPRFAERVCAGVAGDGSDRRRAVELFVAAGHCLDSAAGALLAAEGGRHAAEDDEEVSSAEDVNLLQLCVHVLLRLSEHPCFGAALDAAWALPDLPMALPPFQGSYANALVLLACDIMAHPALEFVCPALAATMRNTIALAGAGSSDGVVGGSGGAEGDGGSSDDDGASEGAVIGPMAAHALVDTLDLITSRPAYLRRTPAGVCVVNLLLEAVAGAIAADYAGQAELVLAVVRHGARLFSRLRHAAPTPLLPPPPPAPLLEAVVPGLVSPTSPASPPPLWPLPYTPVAVGAAPLHALPPSMAGATAMATGLWLGLELDADAALGDPGTGWPMQRVICPLLDTLGPRLEAVLPPPPPTLRGGGRRSPRAAVVAAMVEADEESALEDIESAVGVAGMIATVKLELFGVEAAAAQAALPIGGAIRKAAATAGPATGNGDAAGTAAAAGFGLGPDRVRGAAPAVCGRMAPTRARLEGWHFSYLWSVLFLRTQEEGLFPGASVRLFQLNDDWPHSEDGGNSGDSDGRGGEEA